ncbi:GATOR complex protein wdr59 [Halocaridina rubra]|uniref:GATOR complex protein wdr59 n=1 Tax=Halocaridina rubra TaxID=373956 RepID=A0AAN8X948_HALRR
MAVRWSCENVVAEHRDLQASAMALDCNGEYTVLAGRRYLALISLDKPTEIVKRISRSQQKYDVIACEFHPSQTERKTFVIGSGERAEVCLWDDGQLKTLHVLRAHTRTLTDLNWHRFDPHILSTCSIDTFVHIWDVREARKPVTSLSAIAGATQVKWNKLNQHYLASGHDCDIRVWDDRKPSQPVQYISAHLSKIHGLDWSPNHENHIVSSSNDCTVKFFDITNPRKEENFINTMSPVWRGKYTPFGEGIVTVVIPQLRRGENSLLLWSVTDVSAPSHTFVGHTDIVLEFEWRQSQSNPGDIQMISWARDHSLRIWNIDSQLQRMCGHEGDDDTMLIESTDSEVTSEPAVVQGELSEIEAETVEPQVGSFNSLSEDCIHEQVENVQESKREIGSPNKELSSKNIEITSSSVPASVDLPHPSHELDTMLQLEPTSESVLASTPTSTHLMEHLPRK